MTSKNMHPAVLKLQEYLRINTAYAPFPDYVKSTEFLKQYGTEIGLPYRVLEFVEKKPLVLFTLEGKSPKKGSILLNSHVDVVPVTESLWEFPPFGAEIKNGNIYARGTQDMKSVGIQHLEAIRRIKESGLILDRTVHILFVPDEEIGGTDGMAKFVESEEFRQLNVAVALDEGEPSSSDSISVCYGEREPWWLTVKAEGPAGHASRFVEKTAMMKLSKVINKFMEFREEQRQLLFNHDTHHCGKSLGDVVTVNLTYLEGGNSQQYNIIPVEAKAGFDIRVPSGAHDDLREKIKSWTAEEGVSFDFLIELPASNPNHLMVSTNEWWMVLEESFKQQNLQVKWEIFPMATDSRFIRQLNIPAFGFSPIRRTENKMHNHDEYLPVDVFLEGIEHMKQVIIDLSEEVGKVINCNKFEK